MSEIIDFSMFSTPAPIPMSLSSQPTAQNVQGASSRQATQVPSRRTTVASANPKSTVNHMVANYNPGVFDSGKAVVKANLTKLLEKMAKENPEKWSNFVKMVFFAAFKAGNGEEMFPKMQATQQEIAAVDTSLLTTNAIREMEHDEARRYTSLKIAHDAIKSHTFIAETLKELGTWAYSTLIEVIPAEVWTMTFKQFSTFGAGQMAYIRNQVCYWSLMSNDQYKQHLELTRYVPPWPACGKSRDYYLADDSKKRALLEERFKIGLIFMKSVFKDLPQNSWAVRCYGTVFRAAGRGYSNEDYKNESISIAIKRANDRYADGIANEKVVNSPNFVLWDEEVKSYELATK